MAAGRHPAVPGSGEAYKRWPGEVAERRAEVGGGHTVAGNGVDNTTRRSEGPPARCASLTGNGCGNARVATDPPTACDDDKPCKGWPVTWWPAVGSSRVVEAKYLLGMLGSSVNVVARRNAGGRLPGGKPCEVAPHARFGEGVLETERRDPW